MTDYLGDIDRDERCHLLIAAECRSRNACVMFATFAYGNHPNQAVREDGLNIELHVLSCSRSHPSRAIAIPVAYVSMHALRRLFERGHDITESSHATGVFAFIGVLGYLTHHCKKHVDGGLHLAFSDVLVVGSLHRFMKAQVEETVYDVRTVLPVDELGPHRQELLDQGIAASKAVVAWFKDDDPDVDALAERIPFLPRREDIYPLRAATLPMEGEGT